MAYVPDRGDVVCIHFDPQMGHEQAGHRPAIVLSDRSYNDLLDLAVVCPITCRSKGYRFEVVIPPGLAVRGVVLSDQIKNIDWRARQATYLCTLPHVVVEAVRNKVRSLV
ncbi:MAG: endoribonuclease MazF [Acidobacteria bacterium]|nr:endoribonuclease MazF [Acidobacteriota bacterium]